jgi:hypothetical protein
VTLYRISVPAPLRAQPDALYVMVHLLCGCYEFELFLAPCELLELFMGFFLVVLLLAPGSVLPCTGSAEAAADSELSPCSSLCTSFLS